ncbi:MAG: sugar phosphate isomerase/epimerase [bacterium]|nr:sugar phosphate isomerase/epimerase [bacterium]
MKTATGNRMTPQDISWEERCKVVKEAGFDGVEMWIGTEDFDMESTDDDLKRLNNGIQAAGLEVSSVASTMGWNNPICSPDDAVFNRALEIGKRQIQVAGIFGTDATLVVTGRHDASVDQLEGWKRIVSGFQELGQVAADAGVRVGAETCPKLSFNLMTPYECLGFVEDVGMDSVGIYLDTANVTYSGYPEHFIRALGDRIVRIHFKDRIETPDGRGGATWPGNGVVNFGPVMDACREIGHDAWATMEYGTPHTLETMSEAASSTRAIVDG